MKNWIPQESRVLSEILRKDNKILRKQGVEGRSGNLSNKRLTTSMYLYFAKTNIPVVIVVKTILVRTLIPHADSDPL